MIVLAAAALTAGYLSARASARRSGLSLRDWWGTLR